MRYLGLAACLFLIGCASAEEKQQTVMKANLDPWIGQSIAAYVALRGPFTTAIDLDKNSKMFQWLITQQTAAIAVPINGMVIARGPQTLECRVSMTATARVPNPTLADYRITQYQWSGAC